MVSTNASSGQTYRDRSRLSKPKKEKKNCVQTKRMVCSMVCSMIASIPTLMSTSRHRLLILGPDIPLASLEMRECSVSRDESPLQMERQSECERMDSWIHWWALIMDSKCKAETPKTLYLCYIRFMFRRNPISLYF